MLTTDINPFYRETERSNIRDGRCRDCAMFDAAEKASCTRYRMTTEPYQTCKSFREKPAENRGGENGC